MNTNPDKPDPDLALAEEIERQHVNHPELRGMYTAIAAALRRLVAERDDWRKAAEAEAAAHDEARAELLKCVKAACKESYNG